MDGSVGGRLRATAAAVGPQLDPRRADPARLATTVALGALAAFCLLWRLGRADLRTDEQADGVAAWQAVGGDWAVVNGHPPLVRLFLGAGQVAFGRTALGVRVGPALVGLALVALLLAMGRRLGGFRVGAIAAGVWAVVPRPVAAAGHEVFAVRLDRYAYLEPWSSFGLVAAAWAGWAWARRGGWRLAAGTGALVGLGAAFKPTVGLVVPALVSSALVVRRDAWRAVLVEALAVGGTAAAVLVASFAPAGRAGPRMLWDTVDFQLDHVRQGHPLVVAGSRTQEQPWWANLWHQWEGVGPAVTVVLVGAGLVALTGRHRALALHLHGVLLVVVAAHLASPVALPHYHVLWLPLLALLGALGLDTLLRSAPAPARAVGCVGLAVLVVAGAVGVGQVATLPEGDAARVADRVAADGVEVGRVVYAGEPVASAFPGALVLPFRTEEPARPPDVMVLDVAHARSLPAAEVERFRQRALAAGLAAHRVGEVEAWW